MDPINKKHQKALYFLSTFAIGLSVGRALYTGHFGCLFLIWNLFLAWIPYWIGVYGFKPAGKINIRTLFVLGAWIAFLPNAPYLVTDFIHFNNDGKLKWLDIILFSTYATSGLLLFHKSLGRFRQVYLKNASLRIKHACTIVILGISAYGIYVGRVMRFNSWDVITNPYSLSCSIFRSVFHTGHLIHTMYITSLFMVFLYISVIVFDHLLSAPHEEKN